MTQFIKWFNEIGNNNVASVGGKNASLGEMICHLSTAGVQVPQGFALTTEAYQLFLQENKLQEDIMQQLAKLNTSNVNQLAATGLKIRQQILAAPFPKAIEADINSAVATLQEKAATNNEPLPVAVRSSATAEDLPNASFAGQQETFLNVRGVTAILSAIKAVYASLFNDRAIAYRVHQGFEHHKVAISAGIQQMVRSETGTSGVMFSLDTESGSQDVVFITASYGLGESVVQGLVNPDEFYVHKATLKTNRPAILKRTRGSKACKMIYTNNQSDLDQTVATVDVDKTERRKFCISDEQVTELAQQALIIEQHYQHPMDIEWAYDGDNQQLYILQARPETVKSRRANAVMERYILDESSTVLTEGRSIGQRIGAGPVRIVLNIRDMDDVKPGDVLVTDMTDPDWEPVMKRTAAIVTNRGGRTCHAAIIARELGIPAVVGCGDATKKLAQEKMVTVSCAEGDTGKIYQGKLNFRIQKDSVDTMPKLPFNIMMNIGNPDRAFTFQNLPNQGIGLARLEFIINRMIGVHPKALMNFDKLPKDIKKLVSRRIAGYPNPIEFYITKLQEGIATLAAAFTPKPVIVRLSDFKSNEYANLIGGKLYEPEEGNPMLGFRGASRYISENFRDCFELECRAIKLARDVMGFTNIELMVPFVRTLDEAKQVIELLAENGLERGKNGLRMIMMCELPTNAILAEQFLEYFDGFSIGSNDLTQLTLGLDRDSGLISHLFDERDPAVKLLLQKTIEACRKANKYIGICGQAPSDHPDFAQWLMEMGIDSISLNPDSVLDTWFFLAENKSS